MISSAAVDLDLWAEAQRKLDLAADQLGLDDAMHRVLRNPKRELEVHFPIHFDDGHVEAFTGYRVHHNLNRGPATGGVRYTRDLSLDLVRANAMATTWKAALVEIPYGGAFGGVVVNPRRLSVREREGLTRRYATEISLLVGPEKDIPSPDVNTGSQTMAWMMDTFSMHLGYTVAGSVIGKPVAVGGTAGRREATSRGAFRATLAAARASGLDLSRATIAVQGFGRVGSALAAMLADAGARIVAIADDRDAVIGPRGLDATKAAAWVRRNDSIAGLPDADPVAREEVFGTRCDILVTAGVQNQITADRATRIRAGIVVEAANGPTTPEADAILHDRGVAVLPDVLCTAGGMVLGYFEWVQDMQSFFWSEAEIAANLDRIMDDATAAVVALAEERHADLRSAATMLAVRRVADATSLRGLYP